MPVLEHAGAPAFGRTVRVGPDASPERFPAQVTRALRESGLLARHRQPNRTRRRYRVAAPYVRTARARPVAGTPRITPRSCFGQLPVDHGSLRLAVAACDLVAHGHART